MVFIDACACDCVVGYFFVDWRHGGMLSRDVCLGSVEIEGEGWGVGGVRLRCFSSVCWAGTDIVLVVTIAFWLPPLRPACDNCWFGHVSCEFRVLSSYCGGQMYDFCCPMSIGLCRSVCVSGDMPGKLLSVVKRLCCLCPF